MPHDCNPFVTSALGMFRSTSVRRVAHTIQLVTGQEYELSATQPCLTRRQVLFIVDDKPRIWTWKDSRSRTIELVCAILVRGAEESAHPFTFPATDLPDLDRSAVIVPDDVPPPERGAAGSVFVHKLQWWLHWGLCERYVAQGRQAFEEAVEELDATLLGFVRSLIFGFWCKDAEAH